MDFRKSIPTVLLLTLAVPTVQARSNAPEAVPADSISNASASSGSSALHSGRRLTGRESAFSAETVGLASEYLACRARGADARPESAAAWERFHPSCNSAIRCFAASFRSRGVDVDDCAQEVWTDLLTSLPRLTMDPSRGRFTSWLYSIVRSKAVNTIRKQARGGDLAPLTESEVATGSIDPVQNCERQSDRECVRQVMAELKGRASTLSYRVLHLRWIEELSVAEVAGKLGLSSGQVWAREYRMKRQLKAILAARGMASVSAEQR